MRYQLFFRALFGFLIVRVIRLVRPGFLVCEYRIDRGYRGQFGLFPLRAETEIEARQKVEMKLRSLDLWTVNIEWRLRRPSVRERLVGDL